MLNERVMSIMLKTVELNEIIKKLNKSMDDLNLEMVLVSIENNPSLLTSDMIVEFAKAGIDLTKLTPVAKGMVPPCFHPASISEEENEKGDTERGHKDSVNSNKDIDGYRAFDPEDTTEKLTSDKNHFIKKGINISSDSPKEKKKKLSKSPLLADGDKRGVIFIRCNKDVNIENQVLDRMFDAATDRDILVQDMIVNELNGKDKLKQWVGTGVINYILINNLNEYSRNRIDQENLVEAAYRNGIHILVGENEFRPIIPPEFY